MSLKEQIERDGVILVKNALTPAEVGSLRSYARKHLKTRWVESHCGKAQTNGAAICETLEWLFAHPNIISALKQSLGEDICFTGNCDIHQNTLGKWHKDMGFFGSDPFGPNDNRIYKVGVYLQDQEEPHRGLQYRRGSHRFNNLTEGEHNSMTSSVGDIIIFDIRVTHSGMLPSLGEKMIWLASRLFSTAKGEIPMGRIIKEIYWKLFRIKPREAIFFAFGPKGNSTDRFAQNLVVEQLGSLSSEAHLSPSLINKLAKQEVSVSPTAKAEYRSTNQQFQKLNQL